jgi:hypothetical protein
MTAKDRRTPNLVGEAVSRALALEATRRQWTFRKVLRITFLARPCGKATRAILAVSAGATGSARSVQRHPPRERLMMGSRPHSTLLPYRCPSQKLP